tara:strand:- start:2016 stop:2321 length:306 start_codon:yes stop_codon:yes gene_type:complete
MVAERRLEERLERAEKESKWLNMSLKEYAQKKMEAIDYAKVVASGLNDFEPANDLHEEYFWMDRRRLMEELGKLEHYAYASKSLSEQKMEKDIKQRQRDAI